MRVTNIGKQLSYSWKISGSQQQRHVRGGKRTFTIIKYAQIDLSKEFWVELSPHNLGVPAMVASRFFYYGSDKPIVTKERQF